MFESYDQDIGMLTNKISKKLIYYVNSNLEKFNLTTEQWVVLLNLSKQNKISQKLLAKLSGKDQSTLTRILDILERKNFIERHPSKEDRRSFEIHITETGLNITEQVIPFLDELFNNLLEDISYEKLKIYNEVLLKIDNNINKLQ
ncbi:MarR family winged helix-turn-helix transcriptional regulator [Clostridium saccharobutylicum]|uniref:Transcriptional regulator, MarR family n=1 Tax=Clostridium saccharobutylicum DSM 13864 TaxID=1345695 RepID=U5MYI5_CLOSA|nr:MarR family transcriptional regulator [Clostridium saccharobutylicum]AGX44711.1 transcriptional regulator, MarR family [Clostridium saccharobutylicum DSM 13864]AQR92000.1 transcriptional regulator SlyA [Clostridium saccharobutylicum]AQS01902.1 transcriptional regulator SlyA [Clostridium saccharobutylicum]AQS11502.1 transcriptional regulator SlyA [Clostridium saccharobutylicum]AQS15885.1 transcriptional regulator SlyA [Clostridium saccharobutylicum]